MRRISSTVLSAVLGFALATPGEADAVGISGLERIRDSGVLRVATFSRTRFPFTSFCEGAHPELSEREQGLDPRVWLDGFDPGLARGLARSLASSLYPGTDRSVRVEWVLAPSHDEVIQQVAEGAADLGISKLSITPERQLLVDFTDSYLDAQQAVLASRRFLAERLDQGTYDLEGAKVGVVDRTSFVSYLESALPGTTPVLGDSLADLQERLLRGEFPLLFVDTTIARSFQMEGPGRAIEFETIVLEGRGDPMGIAIPKGADAFKEWLNTYLRWAKSVGVMSQLHTRHFSENRRKCVVEN